MKIKLKNGKEFEYLIAFETEEYFNGSNRRTLTFECDKNAISVDELNSLLSDELNTENIVLLRETSTVNENEQYETEQEEKETAENIVIDEQEQHIIENYESLENVYDGYVLKLKCGVENKLITSETPDEQAVYEDRIIFKLGKRTYIEEQLKRLGL